MEMRRPLHPAICKKRDFDASFKRVRACPELSIIFRTEFHANLLGIYDPDATSIFFYLALPFGRRASAVFAFLGERKEEY